MFLKDFDYFLPPELIAQKPATPRDACKLMVLDRAKRQIEHKQFYDILDYLKPGDVLVFNNSKVIPARILFKRGERTLEIFLIRQKDHQRWFVLAKPGKVLKQGAEFKINENLSFVVEDILEDGQRVVAFSLSGADLENELFKIGLPPFPPYIKNPQASFADYQTVYADKHGSVAAPTAGLHFTENLLAKLKNKGIQLEFVTLHVGLGTFLPIKVPKIEEHKMHEEFFEIDDGTAGRLFRARQEGRRIVAVGTTSVRVLESAFDQKNGFATGLQKTNIFIYPGYEWKCVRAMITNFHLPQSSLLLLVSSFAGKDFTLEAYDEAIKRKYRFYSFGDAMFVF